MRHSTGGIPDTLLSQFSEFLASQTGLHFPGDRWDTLRRKIVFIARDLGFTDEKSCVMELVSSPLTETRIKALAEHLTIGETYFFRDKRIFEILKNDILPGLITSRRKNGRCLRIWSAGCCTGEEPYSIAILLSELLPDLKIWDVKIFGTDINSHFLKRASKGAYGEWSFRGSPQGLKDTYFKKTKSGYEIHPRIKEMVSFSYYNLAEKSHKQPFGAPGSVDLVFCRNVLIYFTNDHAKKAVQAFYRSLVDGGWLITGSSEGSKVLASPFIPVVFSDGVLYKKEQRKTQDERDASLSRFSHRIPADLLAGVGVDPSASVKTGAVVDLPESRIHSATKSPDMNEPQMALDPEIPMLCGQGRYAEMADKLMRQLSLNPGDPQLISLLARAYANQGRLDESLAWCEKAIDSNKLDPGLYYLQAMIFLERDSLENAILLLKRALYLDSRFVMAYFALGGIMLRQRRIEESRRYFAIALELLSGYNPEEMLPESEGITAGRLLEIITSMVSAGEIA